MVVLLNLNRSWSPITPLIGCSGLTLLWFNKMMAMPRFLMWLTLKCFGTLWPPRKKLGTPWCRPVPVMEFGINGPKMLKVFFLPKDLLSRGLTSSLGARARDFSRQQRPWLLVKASENDNCAVSYDGFRKFKKSSEGDGSRNHSYCLVLRSAVGTSNFLSLGTLWTGDRWESRYRTCSTCFLIKNSVNPSLAGSRRLRQSREHVPGSDVGPLHLGFSNMVRSSPRAGQQEQRYSKMSGLLSLMGIITSLTPMLSSKNTILGSLGLIKFLWIP